MKKLLLLFSWWPLFLTGQVSVDFENGLPASAMQFPAERWDVSSDMPLDGAASLKHIFDNSVSSCDRISFRHDPVNPAGRITWQFLIRYPYKPSASNNWSVFLMSEKPAGFMDPDGGNPALIFGVNYLSNDDTLKLFLQDGKQVKVLCATSFNWETADFQGIWKFRISYDGTGTVRIESAPRDSGFVLTGTANLRPDELPASEWFGIRYAYTSTRDRLLTFDDLLIAADFQRDSTPPVLEAVHFPSRNSIAFLFSESVDPALVPRIRVDGTVAPDSVGVTGNTVFSRFAGEFANDRTYRFTLGPVGRP